MDIVKRYAKAIVAFVVPILVNMVIDLLQNEQPWPHTQDEWIRYVGTSLAVGLGVTGVRNKVTQQQVDKAVEKGDIPPQKPAPPPITMVPDWPVVEPSPEDLSSVDQILAEYDDTK